MKNCLCFKITSNFVELQKLLEEVSIETKKLGLVPESVRKIKLIVEELLTNIIKYGYPKGRSGAIELNIFQNKKSLRLELCDNAAPFDPTIRRDDSRADSIETLKIGGLGLIIVRKSCSRMKYKFNHGKNLLSLTVLVSYK